MAKGVVSLYTDSEWRCLGVCHVAVEVRVPNLLRRQFSRSSRDPEGVGVRVVVSIKCPRTPTAARPLSLYLRWGKATLKEI